MTPFDLKTQIKEIELRTQRFAAQGRVSEAMLRNTQINSLIDYQLQQLVLMVDRSVWSHKIGHEKYRWPRDWWEAVKERWAPKWLLARWPVQYERVSLDVYHMFPDFEYPKHLGPYRLKVVEGWDD